MSPPQNFGGRIDPEAYAEDFEEIFKCLSEGYIGSILLKNIFV
jgi:hypothetical protein